MEVASGIGFTQLYNSTAALRSSDFRGVLYLGTDNQYDYFLFEHSVGDDLNVKVPVGIIKLSGRMTQRRFGCGIPLAAIMNSSDYIDLLKAQQMTSPSKGTIRSDR